MYPSIISLMNCSKATKTATVLAIDNTKRRGTVDVHDVMLTEERAPGIKHEDVTAFFADAIYVESNAIAVAKRFNLPGFSEVDAYIQKNYPGIYAHANGQAVDLKRDT